MIVPIMYVARGADDILFDKRSGEVVQRLPFPQFTDLANVAAAFPESDIEKPMQVIHKLFELGLIPQDTHYLCFEAGGRTVIESVNSDLGEARRIGRLSKSRRDSFPRHSSLLSKMKPDAELRPAIPPVPGAVARVKPRKRRPPTAFELWTRSLPTQSPIVAAKPRT